VDGKYVELRLSDALPKYIGGSIIDPGIPVIVQNYGYKNPYPTIIGELVNQSVSGSLPSIAPSIANTIDGKKVN
jgi:hypothetical protein